METYHIPVLLKESVEALNIKDGGVYVDATLGGGGHTTAILESGKEITLFAFDQDPDALIHNEELAKKYAGKLFIINDNFANLRTQLSLHRIKKIDGILFDLGVSSHQINVDSRGFSFSLDGDLDMRMDQTRELTAKELINHFPYEELRNIFRDYGEEKQASRIAKAIVEAREEKPFSTTLELSEFLDRCTVGQKKLKIKARIFQAIRIFINGEIEVLKCALEDAVKILNPEGRIAVISYHSLEDRIVKKLFKFEEKDCICPPKLPICVCNKKSRLKILTRKPIIPSEEEIEKNNRARSAKLRIAKGTGNYEI